MALFPNVVSATAVQVIPSSEYHALPPLPVATKVLSPKATFWMVVFSIAD
jgi:hypothetical protein